jgi:dipeptidyl aminopeptidase/acylaminoacyl peptidase
MRPTDILVRASRPPDQVLRYGDRDDQVADLRLPAPGRGAGDARSGRRAACPLVIFLHGGFWRAEFDRAHAGPLAQALASSGFAVCTPEYRRTGQAGGGWPGTFDDVAAAVDALPEIVAAAAGGGAAAGGQAAGGRAAAGGQAAGAGGQAAEAGEQADARRVVLAGHSAGGQLALWAAGRRRLPPGAPWYPARSPGGLARSPAGVVSLAGVCDLAACFRLKLGAGAAGDLMGGGPESFPGRYLATDPMRLLPAGTRVRLVHGMDDDRVPPEQSSSYAARARGAGDDVACDLIPACGHFEVIDPLSAAWPVVLAAFRSAAGVAGAEREP